MRALPSSAAHKEVQRCSHVPFSRTSNLTLHSGASSCPSWLVFIGIVLLSDYNPEAKGVAGD